MDPGVREIRLEAGAVAIMWADGRVCRYPYRYLRLQCGCAACIEEMTGRRLLVAASVPENIVAADYFTVGRYAVQFLWSDGHSTGIYPYDSLLRMAEEDAAVECRQSG
jgi:DUF971 family protein